MTTPDPHDWTEANQGYLVAELARLKTRLRGEDETPASKALEQAGSLLPFPAAIDALSRAFSLTPFERDLLLLCAGVEIDRELAALCADAGRGRPHATFGFALGALADPHWSALTPVRPLRRWRLIEPTEDAPLVSARLSIDERVLHYLAGVNYVDARLQPLLRRILEPTAMAHSQESIARDITAAMEEAGSSLPLWQLWGKDLHGKRDVAARAAGQCGLELHGLAGEDIPANPQEAEALAALWEREAALLESALLVECADSTPAPAVLRFVEWVGGVTFLSVPEPVTSDRAELRYRVDKPDCTDQLRLWALVLNGSAALFGSSLDAVASQFRLSAQDIRRLGSLLERDAAGLPEPQAAMWQACRGLERRRLDGLAQRIEPAAHWDDLVLPELQASTLRRIAAHVRHRFTVYEQWGFTAKNQRGLGITALFAGESGTGKTMAAEVLANELHLDLYRIDLSAVVSKYIGETEKNLARVFNAAEGDGAILLFDEADALFGKRSEVKDSHDRYANIEVSYLLQRMEAYRGLAILTTNQEAALDPAFQRRLRFVVHFSFPDKSEREEIWRRAFPDQAPTDKLAFAKLAQLQMTGGHICNIALNAAFQAAEDSEPVRMTHLLQAAHDEAAKRGRPLVEAETRGWV